LCGVVTAMCTYTWKWWPKKNPLTYLVSLTLPFFSAGVSCECLVH